MSRQDVWHSRQEARILRSINTLCETWYNRLGSKNKLEKLVSQSKRFVGAAPKQVDQFKRDAAKWVKRFPDSKQVKPGKML